MPSRAISTDSVQDAINRGYVYHIFSRALVDRNPEILTASELKDAYLGLGIERDMPLPEEPKSDAQTEFNRVFSHNLSPDCPPYETQFGKIDVFRQTHTLADLNGFYHAFGMGLEKGDRRPDHLPVELEFASLLCLKQGRALKSRHDEHAEICRGARAKFLAHHLNRWVPSLAEAISKKKPDTYYASVVRALSAFIQWDTKSFGVVPEQESFVEIQMEEPEDRCQSCFGGTDEAC